MSYAADTIAAIATAPGAGAVAVIRISGPQAISFVETAWRGKQTLAAAQERRCLLGELLDADGLVADQVLATVFRGPRSYTGEDVVELATHGGVLVTRQVLTALLAKGARPAEPGEFTQRAFLNGKMDLTQAEAVMDLISAQTTLALRAAHGQLEVGLTISEMRAALLHVLAHVEAYIDFPEEEISPETNDELLGRIAAISQTAHQLLATADQGRVLREGVSTVLCGLPNAGKSSLLNKLLGFDRAIVSPKPGTTRDTIEEVINLHGYPIRLVDTAGVRATEDELEQAGVERSQQQLLKADLLLEIADSTQPATERLDIPELATGTRLLVLNKADQPRHQSWQEVEGILISCATGAGIDQLTQAIASRIGQGMDFTGSSQVAINARHQACLRRALVGLEAGAGALRSGVSPEFVSIELREAMTAIGEVTGRMDTEELLGSIFSQFCIGK
jgi:tRNA modification GTPase